MDIQDEEKNIYDQLSAINPNQTSYTVCFEDSDEENDPRDSSDAITNVINSPVVKNTHDSNKELTTKNDTNSPVTRNNITVANDERDNLLYSSKSNYIQSQDFCRKRKYSSETDKEKCAKIMYSSETDKEKCAKTICEDRSTVINEKNDIDKTEEKQLSKQYYKEAQGGSKSEKLETINNTIPHNSQNTDPTIMQCYRNLLKTVSEHLYEIIHTFDNNAIEIINKNLTGTSESRKSWSRCLRKKQSLFNLSYCTVQNVIVPQKHNNNFIDDFVNDSCSLVNAKGKTCTYSRMKQLVTEMIEWTERKSSMKQENENNVDYMSKTRSYPSSTLAITISDDEEEDKTKPIILTLTKEECCSQKDNEQCQSIKNEDISSSYQQNSAVDEKDPLANSEIDVKGRDPLENSAICKITYKDPLLYTATDETDLLNKSVNDENVLLVNSIVVENNPLHLDSKNITSSKKRETVSVDQVYSTLSIKDSAQIKKRFAENNLVLNIQEHGINQNDGCIQITQVHIRQDSSMLPQNLMPLETEQKTTLDHDLVQELSKPLHVRDGLVPSASRTVHHYPPAPTPVQAPKISVRSDDDLGLSHQYSSAPANSDPNLLDHQLSVPHFVPYRQPLIYNQTIVNKQNSTVFQHSSLAQGQFIPPLVNQQHSQALPQYTLQGQFLPQPVNQHHSQALPQYTLPSNLLLSQMYNEKNAFNPASQQYSPQTSALPPMQKILTTQHDQLVGSKVQSYMPKHNTTAQNNTNNKNNNLKKVRKTNKKSNTVPANLQDPRYYDKPGQSSQIFSPVPPWRKDSLGVSDILKDSGDRNQLKELSILQEYLNQISSNQTNKSEHQLHYNQQNQVSTQKSSQPQQQMQQLSQGRKWYPQSVSTSTAQPLPDSIAQQQPYILPLPPPPPYTTGSRHCLLLNGKSPKQQIQRANQPNEQMENTRSVSTDSGIVSPLNFSTISPPGPVVNESADLYYFGPMITHVTSLNPDAKYHSANECYVCKATTRKKCLGCHRIYYCSVKCQSAHWHEHGKECEHGKKCG